jgi:hypothetical protein
MGVQRRKAVRWGALAAVLTVILSVAGIALGTTAPPTGGEMGADPELEAAGALTDPLPLRPSTTVAPVTTVAPRPSTSRPAPTTTVAEQVTPPVPVTTTAPARPSTTLVPATTVPRPASSWSLDDKGISMRLWVEPAQPHVGDTVTLHFETWATVPTDFCCMNHLYVAGELIYSRLHDQGPCPLAPSTRHQRVTYVVTEPGPLALQLQANRVDLCTGFPQFTTNNLHASVVVSP